MAFRSIANGSAVATIPGYPAVAPDPEAAAIQFAHEESIQTSRQGARPILDRPVGIETRGARTNWIEYTFARGYRPFRQFSGIHAHVERQAGAPRGEQQVFGGARRLTLRAIPQAWDAGTEIV